MKFFIDFEATQFKHKIISIGCVAEDGSYYETLVKPNDDKVSGFITRLTGITNEMLEDAPNANTAFINLMTFVASHSFDDGTPEYYCYGDTDAGFIRNTLVDITDFMPYTFAQALSANLIDFSKEVKGFFSAPNNISLRKIYNLVHEEEVEQHHNALEDAQMLQEVVEKLKDKCVPEDLSLIAAMPKTEKPAYKGKAPEKFVTWPNDKWDANTGATEKTPWEVCCTCGCKVKYFDSTETAMLWAMRYLTRGMKVKNPDHRANVTKKINDAISSGKIYCNFHWYSWAQAENCDPYVIDKRD